MRNACSRKDAIRRLWQTGVTVVLLCLAAMAAAAAETVSTASLKKGYAPAELDQMLAPVALYPDGLLLQVLMASTYPAEVLEAARWLEDNPGIKGDAAPDAAESFAWHVSVKSLLPFPDVLAAMSSNMDWTVRLGSAFHTQQEDVMARIQHLRRQASAAGNLSSDERMNVVKTGDNIAIEPASAEVIYVPYYNPVVVYGSWMWPGYAPYYWAPWRGYACYSGCYSGGLMWGSGIWFNYARFYGRVDWKRHHVYWNQPARRPVATPLRPAGKPRTTGRQGHARPGMGAGKNSHNQAKTASRPEKAVSGHPRSGAARQHASSSGESPSIRRAPGQPGRAGTGEKASSRPAVSQLANASSRSHSRSPDTPSSRGGRMNEEKRDGLRR